VGTKALPPILGPREVAAFAQAALDFLRRNVDPQLPISLPQVEQIVRLFPLAKRCSAARKRRDLTIADVARELRVPQYRLKAIESCRPAEVEPRVLDQYVRFLRLSRWYSRWARANQAHWPRPRQPTETATRSNNRLHVTAPRGGRCPGRIGAAAGCASRTAAAGGPGVPPGHAC
jgi:hypothetical protein